MSAVRRVITGVSESPGSLQALRYAVGAARDYGAAVLAVHVWSPPGGEFADRNHPSAYLRQVWAAAAEQRLRSAVELALGGAPRDLPFEARVFRGEPGRILVGLADGEDDLLVVGAGRRGTMSRILACHVTRYCLARATSPVVAVPPPALAQLGHGLRGWAMRHRGLSAEQAALGVGGR